MELITIASIAFDAGTQIRAAINEDVVANYAERMTAGDVFPAVTLFHDGNRHYLGDGFHRCLAAKRNGLTEIPATVQAGTKADALWFALGANRANANPLTGSDKKHAITLALTAFPDRSLNQIAEQVGCSRKWVQDVSFSMATCSQRREVTGADGKVYPSSRSKVTVKREAIAEMAKAGASSGEIQRTLKAHPGTIAAIKRSLGLTSVDRSKGAAQARRARMRELAADGHTSKQIASELGLSEEGCREIINKEGIVVQADIAMGTTRRIDSNRVIEQMVMDAENLTADVGLINFGAIDRTRLAGWLKSLQDSRDQLGGFIRRLMKEQQKHEAA